MKSTQEGLSSSDMGGAEILDALEMRLTFRIAFLTTISVAHQRNLSLSQRSWDALLELLPGVSASKELSITVPESFSVKLQRKLASTVPPRPAVTIAFEAAHEYLERLCLDGRAVTNILKYYDSQSLMVCVFLNLFTLLIAKYVQTFITLFQTRKPQPAVFIRTLLQYYIFGDVKVLGTISIRQLLEDDFSSLVLAGDQLLDPKNDEVEVPHDPRFNIAKRMDFFREQAAQSYLDVLRTLCQNRCRTRRELTHSITNWENLQLDAEDLDVELREFTKEEPVIDPAISPDPIYSFPLSSWSYFYKLRQMEWIVQMGFELEVYQVDELAGMYWYLQHLTQTRIRHVERIRGFTMKRFSALGRGRNPALEKELGIGRALSYINYSMLEATAIQGFADALTCLYTVLIRRGVILSPVRPYSNGPLRYELRMKPFLPIGLPEFLPYEQFHLSVTQPDESTSDLMDFASEAVARARKDFELMSKLDGKTARCLGSEEAWTKNVKDSLKACISASISISIVKKALEKAESTGGKLDVNVEVPPVGKGYHNWWIVPKIVVGR
jgi:N-alpha-acetyltransferase 35, NatC auxiliary subunit